MLFGKQMDCEQLQSSAAILSFFPYFSSLFVRRIVDYFLFVCRRVCWLVRHNMLLVFIEKYGNSLADVHMLDCTDSIALLFCFTANVGFVTLFFHLKCRKQNAMWIMYQKLNGKSILEVQWKTIKQRNWTEKELFHTNNACLLRNRKKKQTRNRIRECGKKIPLYIRETKNKESQRYHAIHMNGK